MSLQPPNCDWKGAETTFLYIIDCCSILHCIHFLCIHTAVLCFVFSSAVQQQSACVIHDDVLHDGYSIAAGSKCTRIECT